MLATCSPTSSLSEVESSDSSSPLTKVYSDDKFQLSVDNDIAFHVANNAVRLRKLRGYSQAKVAAAMNTSQPRVARIEGGDDNITLSTLAKLIKALKGRLRLSIEPREIHLPRLPQWWEVIGSDLQSDRVWNLSFTATSERSGDTRAAVAGFVTNHQLQKIEVIDAELGDDDGEVALDERSNVSMLVAAQHG